MWGTEPHHRQDTASRQGNQMRLEAVGGAYSVTCVPSRVTTQRPFTEAPAWGIIPAHLMGSNAAESETI
jgi:hypothetical protein